MDSMRLSREALRRKLLDERMQAAECVRDGADESICSFVADYLETRLARPVADSIIACYWPVRGEPDLRALWPQWGGVALPVVVERNAALRFARWEPGMAMRRGGFEIPVPEHPQWVDPDLVIVPCLGFFLTSGGQRFRLGYGGGYYDRTFAVQPCQTLGVAYAQGRLFEFAVGTHDIPLDAIITQAGPV